MSNFESAAAVDPNQTLTTAEADELKQLAILFAELEREFGESDDPDLRFAAAFARQCALGELSD